MNWLKTLPRHQVAITFGVAAFVCSLYVFVTMLGSAQTFASMCYSLGIGLVTSWLVYDRALVGKVFSRVFIWNKIVSLSRDKTFRYFIACLGAMVVGLALSVLVLMSVPYLDDHQNLAMLLYCGGMVSMVVSSLWHFIMMDLGAQKYTWYNDEFPIEKWTHNVLMFSPVVVLLSPVLLILAMIAVVMFGLIQSLLAFAELLVTRQFLVVTGGVVVGSLASVLLTGTEGMFLARLAVGVVSGMVAGKGLYYLGYQSQAKRLRQAVSDFASDQQERVSEQFNRIYSL
jgi:hypothetical protein